MSMVLNRLFPLVLAPTGMVITKAQTPYVPISPKEIISDVKDCYKIGITSVHLHARDDDGAPSWKKEIYQEIIYGIREFAPELAINVSTSGRDWSEIEKRADCLALLGDTKPDLASLTTSSLNFITGASVNAPDTVRKLARIMMERGIVPELELFDLGMVNAVSVLKKEGLLPKTLVTNLFFGNIYGAQATPFEMAAMVTSQPENTIWSGAGIGEYQARAQSFSLACGGGARTGIEDNIYLNKSELKLARNIDLVSRVHKMGDTLNRTVMPPAIFKSLIKQV